MGRDDTFPLQQIRVRVPFRDMTTAEAEHISDAIWPYVDAKVATLHEQLERGTPQLSNDVILIAMGELMELNPADQEERRLIKKAFRVIRFLAHIQGLMVRICVRCILPWAIAASAGTLGVYMTEYLPSLAKMLRDIGLIAKT
jgi:hypothetical protein